MIYVVSHFYPPVQNPPANRMGHLAKLLKSMYGAENLVVVTGRPNYPDGKLSKEYRWRLFKRRTGDFGETIHHLYELPAPFGGFLRKTIGYFSFAFSVFVYFLFRRVREDSLVFVTVPPYFLLMQSTSCRC